MSRGWDEEDVHRYQQGLVNLGYVAIRRQLGVSSRE